MSYHYAWLIWSSTFLVPWLVLFLALPQHRGVMLWASALTAPFGLTEPLFVPEYWNPPSLFELAARTGFDIESLIFSFALGGVGVVLYNAVTGQRWVAVPKHEHRHPRHRFHHLAIGAPVAAFPLLLALPGNPIYPAIATMGLGAVATVACRPDLGAKTLIGGSLFALYYAVFMLGLVVLAPGYIEQVWNLRALSGVAVYGIPLEELLFGFAFGSYWTGIYEHLAWRRLGSAATGPAGFPGAAAEERRERESA